MNDFEFSEEGIYRLCIPFDNIYTSVFLLISDSGTILLDTATTDDDVKNYIIPALKSIEVVPDMIILSHLHDDHCGGTEALLKHFKNVKVGLIEEKKNYQNTTIHLKDGDIIFDRFQVLNIKGHTDDCLAILDLKTKTLLSCDSIQQYGVDKYRTYLENKDEYIESLFRLRKIDIKKIICSHNYEPCGYSIEGKKNIFRLYDICMKV